jgi:hypothetical protein
MTEVLRTVTGFWKRLSHFSSKLCIFRQLLMFFLCQLVIVISLSFLFLLIRCLLYISCVVKGVFALLMIIIDYLGLLHGH